MDLKRILRHLWYPDWVVGRAFPSEMRRRIEDAVRGSERHHRGELKFAIEGGFDLVPLARGLTARERAVELFSRLRVWDTEENSGVLIYVQLADRDIEILADRGINSRVPQEEWDAICHRMEQAYRERRFEEGTLAGVREITELLAGHFPPRVPNRDELPDQPVVL